VETGRQSGFTLIEIMVVVAIVAIATVGVTLSMPGRADQPLARDARRLALLFAQAQTEARTGGRAVTWQADDNGYRFTRKPVWRPANAQAAVTEEAPRPDDFSDEPTLRPRHWEARHVRVQAEPAQAGVFTPEWIAAPMRIELSDDFQRVAIVRDAAGRYAVQP
jgi:general secretion pathway protein H